MNGTRSLFVEPARGPLAPVERIPRARCAVCRAERALWCAGCGSFVCLSHDPRTDMGLLDDAHGIEAHNRGAREGER